MKYRITTRYGDLDSLHSTPHTGVDLAMKTGEPLRAIVNGKISYADYGNLNAGKTIFITDSSGHKFIYGHCSKFGQFHDGQQVHVGDVVGYAGSTGRSFGSHLHFGMKENGHFADPTTYVPQIQHMNDSVPHITQHATQLADSGFNFQDVIHAQMNIYGELLHNLSLNFINIITSIDYTILIHHFQYFLDLFFR